MPLSTPTINAASNGVRGEDRRGRRACDGHYCADRNVDAARRDDERHARCDEHERSRTIQHVDWRAEQMAVEHAQ
jgi:hypothetical protein